MDLLVKSRTFPLITSLKHSPGDQLQEYYISIVLKNPTGAKTSNLYSQESTLMEKLKSSDKLPIRCAMEILMMNTLTILFLHHDHLIEHKKYDTKNNYIILVYK